MKLFFIASFTFLFFQSFSQGLTPGMPAPAIEVETWVKGQPVESFNRDTNYVIEFWATWCGPCKESIPHLTKLAKQYPNTRFVGIAIAEVDTKNVAPFVKKMGDRMNYNVAIDKQESNTARQGFMSAHWLEAAGLNSIPATFVISNNEVAWIGHPTQLDSVLEMVNAKKWNTRAFTKKWKKENEEDNATTRVLTQFENQLKAQAKKGQKKQFYKTLEAEFEYMISNFGLPAINGPIWDWIADPQGTALAVQMKDYAFAVKWMEKLVASPDGQDAAFFDTLAWCYFGTGDKQRAVETEKKALAKMPADAEGRADCEKALQIFQQ